MFLPSDYQSPKTSNGYMKLQEGENKIRILSRPIIGWEEWVDKKPVRYTMDKKPAKPIDPKGIIRHFWAMIVWNYAEEQIQIMHITQASIRNCIEALCKDQDWGAPYFYDLKIIKKGEGKDTEYMVNPLPHKQVSDEIKQRFAQRKCNLEAIFTNEDPYAMHWGIYTPGILSKDDLEANANPLVPISQEKAALLQDILKDCSPDYQNDLITTLKKTNIEAVEQIPVSLWDRIYNAAIKKRNEYQDKLNDKLFAVV